MAETIKFVHEDAAQIISEMKFDLETRMGRQIAPADVEMLLINAFAYRETIIRSGLNDAARQNLVSFARGSALDYLGQLVGVTRLPPSVAYTTIQFTLITGHLGVIIPQGLRVQTTDGKVIFQTNESKSVPAGVLTANVLCKATMEGNIGNGYAINQVNIILDPQPFLTAAQNITVTQNGSDEETDEELRERIMLAPATFSVAGPRDAYKFFAKSASPSIVDVAVISLSPGNVEIYPLLENGGIPGLEILEEVQAICNGEKVRPLTDTVQAYPPTSEDYAINVELTLLTTAIQDDVVAEVTAALESYRDNRKNKLGLDVVRSQISALCMIAGKVYDVNVVSPVADVVADPEVYTNCTSINVSVVGTHDE